jgi:CRP/FNR family cyclic AMP-dependent transcriptional regulator
MYSEDVNGANTPDEAGYHPDPEPLPTIKWDQSFQKILTVKDIFNVAYPEELDAVVGNTIVRKFKAGSMILKQGDSSCDKIYILKLGQVVLYRLTANGKRLLHGHITPYAVFGLRGVLGRTTQRNFAEAVVDSVVYIIMREQFISYLIRQPDVAIQLLELAHFNYLSLEDRLMESSYSTSYAKVAYFLLRNADARSGVITDYTHEQIGNEIGSVRQTVTEALNLMKKRGLITIKPRQIWINDWQGLGRVIKECV